MNYFTPAINKSRRAKGNGFAGILLIILVNDLLTATALIFVLAGRL